MHAVRGQDRETWEELSRDAPKARYGIGHCYEWVRIDLVSVHGSKRVSVRLLVSFALHL
jgi:hypothetical protein